MTELCVKQEIVTLPKDIIMFYQVIVFRTNGEVEQKITLYGYEETMDMFTLYADDNIPVELTCNIEVWKDDIHSETEYISIAKNF